MARAKYDENPAKKAEVLGKARDVLQKALSRWKGDLEFVSNLAAIEGRNQLRRSQMIEADQRYARHVTLAEDLRILAATLPVVLFRRGFFVADRSEASTEDVEPDPA